MDSETERRVLAHLQHLAFYYLALRCSLEKLAELLKFSLGESSPPLEVLSNFIRLESTSKTLEVSFETSLWQAHDKSWRLISLSPVTDIEKAKRRLAEYPTSRGTQCCWCWQDEKSFANLELRPVLDLRLEPIGGRYCHVACLRPFLRLQALVDSVQWEES